MLTRREALTTAAVGAAALATGVPAASAHGHAIPGVRGMDHVGITVPNIAEARDLVRGGHRLPDAAPLRALQRPDRNVHAGPARGRPARGDPRDQRAALRHGLEHRAIRVHRRPTRTRDWRGTPISAATTSRSTSRTSTSPSPTWSPRAYASCSGRSPSPAGPAAGQSINYFQAPFGTYVELISYPHGMAYEATAKRKLWSAHDIGATATNRGIPGLLGLDHVGITVPDIKLARRWLREEPRRRGAAALRPDLGSGRHAHDRPRRRASARRDRGDQRRARPPTARTSSCSSTPRRTRTRASRRTPATRGTTSPSTSTTSAKAADKLGRRRGARRLLGPLPVTEGPAAGQSINYFGTPFGTYVELISYPHGMAYEATAPR